MKELIQRYTDDKLAVVWQSGKCIQSKICFDGLPMLINPENRPCCDASHENIEFEE